MKSLLTALLTIVLVFTLQIYVSAGTPKIYAVIVGVASYKDNSIPNLKFSEKDAKDFSEFIKSPFAGAVPDDNIALLIGPAATRGNIIRSIVEMSKRCTKDDMIIFYFSGHGEADEGDNSGYLLNYDAESNDAPATAISMEEINNRLTKCVAKLKVSYVDACHAGMFTSGGKGSMDADNEIIASSFMQSVANAGDGNVAFLASSAKQQSQESDKLGNGVFTYYLIKGLKGEADKYQKQATGYNDGIVTVGEMVTYLNDKIPAATKYNQKPTVQGVYDEDFPLSILASNAQIADVIAKRPERKNISPSSPSTFISPTFDTATKNMAAHDCDEGAALYGDLNVISNYPEDIYIYHCVGSDVDKDLSALVSKGEKTYVGRIRTNNWTGSHHLSANVKFYFKTTDETKPIKYGTMTIDIETCKIKTVVISNKNLYLSTTGEHR